MKKIITLLLMSIMLLSVISTTALAGEVHQDETYIIDAYRENFPPNSTVVPAPVLQYVETESGSAILCTYKVDEISKFLTSEEGHTRYPTHDITTLISIGVAWNDDEGWGMGESSLDYSTQQMSNRSISINGFPTEDIQFVLFDFRKYNPSEDINGKYNDILFKDGNVYKADLTNNKLRVYFDVSFSNECESVTGFTSEIAELYIPEKDKLPALPSPSIESAELHIKNNTIYYNLKNNNDVTTIINAGHNIDTLVKYTINDQESDVYPVTLTNDRFRAIQIHNNNIPENISTCTLYVAYRDITTNLMSNWTPIDVSIIQDDAYTPDAPTLQLPESGGKLPDSVIPGGPQPVYTTVTECGLCHKCPVQPLGICLWTFIASGVLLILTSTFGTIVILGSRKKNKS